MLIKHVPSPHKHAGDRLGEKGKSGIESDWYTTNAYDSTMDQESGAPIRQLAVKTEYSVPASCFMVTPRQEPLKSAGMAWAEDLHWNIYKVLL